jgi:hypothetical protein
LRVYAREGEQQRGAELLTIPDLIEPRWTPTPEQRASLPDAIWWEVEAFDAMGAPVARGRATASR